MKLEKQYQEILDNAFKTHFPKWEEMSPLDPMKVFAESLCGSIAEVERRQSRFTNTVLDSLPSLFSFSPKKATLPTGLFQVRPSAKLSESTSIPQEATFRFQSESETCHIAPTDQQDILPIFDFCTESTSNGARICFRQTEASEQIELHFVPGKKASGESRKLENIIVIVTELNSGNKHELNWEDLVINDTTESFTQYGILRLEAASGLLTQGAFEVEITLELEHSQFEGQFFTNLIACELHQIEEFADLGSLKGEPWEELPLSDTVITPPAELLLHFPDDHSLRIRRIDSDLLKLRHSNYERFSNSFFYNGVNHSLIIPSAHRLLQNYNGGITILAPKLQRGPSRDWIDNAFEGNSGEYATIVEEISPVAPLTRYVPRESKVEYLRRFYTSMRTFMSSNRIERELIPEQLRTNILASDDSLKAVEISIDEKRQHVSVFLLSQYPSDQQSLKIPTDVEQKVSELLTDTLPLEFDWSIKAFEPVEIQVQVNTEIELDSIRMGLLSEDVLQEKITSKLQNLLLPPPFGMTTTDENYSKEMLFEDLMKRLTAAQGDNSHLRRTEVVSLHGLVVHGDTSQFMATLRRAPGQVYFPKVEINSKVRCVDAHLRDAGSYSSNVREAINV